MVLAQCVCGSGSSFKTCCEPYLLNKAFASSPEKLMRSRYTAFALGGHGEYLINTWSVASCGGLSASHLSLKSMDWRGLQIVMQSHDANKGVVEFKALFLNEHNIIDVHHERSRFERVDGRWFYLDGDILSI